MTNKTNIYDFTDFQTNERNGTYGGLAGDKEGISIDNDYWIVKYPKSTRGMKGDLPSYTTSPLSEFIGSHVFQMLGVDTHDTLLGFRNDKLVVACKDFCKTEGSLREMRTVKNVFNRELSELLEASFSSSHSSTHTVCLEDLLIHFEHNPILRAVPNIKERFWEQFVIDIIINNNDRNNGNWGIMYENGNYRLAPVYDNGASFANKMREKEIEVHLADETSLRQYVAVSRTSYLFNEKPLYAGRISNIDNDDFRNAVEKIVPRFTENFDMIQDFIRGIPEEHSGISVCSNARKEFYLRTMELRCEQFLAPIYETRKEKGSMERNTDSKSRQIEYGD